MKRFWEEYRKSFRVHTLLFAGVNLVWLTFWSKKRKLAYNEISWFSNWNSVVLIFVVIFIAVLKLSQFFENLLRWDWVFSSGVNCPIDANLVSDSSRIHCRQILHGITSAGKKASDNCISHLWRYFCFCVPRAKQCSPLFHLFVTFLEVTFLWSVWTLFFQKSYLSCWVYVENSLGVFGALRLSFFQFLSAAELLTFLALKMKKFTNTLFAHCALKFILWPIDWTDPCQVRNWTQALAWQKQILSAGKMFSLPIDSRKSFRNVVFQKEMGTFSLIFWLLPTDSSRNTLNSMKQPDLFS